MHIHQLRGAIVETRHAARAVAVRSGAVAWQTGPEVESPWRSAAKPIQLWCSLEALGDPILSPEELALGASSHAGQAGHVAALRALLARFGLDEDELRCGAEPPLHRPSAEALLAAGTPYGPIHNDCSGKHTFFLAACVANGWPRDYRPPDHPLQRRIAEVVAAWAGEPVRLATDGCGVPVFGLSIAGMARAWAGLAEAMAGDPCGPLPPPLQDRAGRARAAAIGEAMREHPWWTSGDGRLDLDVARGAREPMVGKIGAQGVFCMALPARRLGLAVKVLDGDEAALAVAVAAALEAAAPGAWVQPEDWRWSEVCNVEGARVGRRLVTGADRVYAA